MEGHRRDNGDDRGLPYGFSFGIRESSPRFSNIEERMSCGVSHANAS